jgi:hypothetical protein
MLTSIHERVIYVWYMLQGEDEIGWYFIKVESFNYLFLFNTFIRFSFELFTTLLIVSRQRLYLHGIFGPCNGLDVCALSP